MSIRDNLGGGSAAKVNVLDTLEEIEANTDPGKPAGALAIKEISNNLGGLRFGSDGEGNVGYFGADGSLIPFSNIKAAYEIHVKNTTKTVFDIGFKPKVLIFNRASSTNAPAMNCMYDENVSKTQFMYYASTSNPAMRDFGDRLVSINENGFTVATTLIANHYSYIAIG